jgi:hypothetical protein
MHCVHSRLLDLASSKVVVELHQDTSGGIMIIVIAWVLDFLTKRHRSASPDAALRLYVVLRVLVVARGRAVTYLFVCCSCGPIDIERRGRCKVRCMRCRCGVVVA